MITFSNFTFEELTIGQTATMTRQVTADDVKAFAMVTHDYNPAHLDDDYAKQSQFKVVIVHGMWTAGLLSALIATKLPGLGSVYLNQGLSFRRPVHLNDTLTATVTVTSKDETKKWVTLDCQVTNQDGKVVVTGEAQVIPPTEKASRDVVKLDDFTLRQTFSE